MFQTTVRCKSLRLAERHKEGNAESVGVGRRADVEEYTEANLEGGDDKTHFFFSFPVSLLDADLKIGDEILVTFERKNR